MNELKKIMDANREKFLAESQGCECLSCGEGKYLGEEKGEVFRWSGIRWQHFHPETKTWHDCDLTLGMKRTGRALRESEVAYVESLRKKPAPCNTDKYSKPPYKYDTGVAINDAEA